MTIMIQREHTFRDATVEYIISEKHQTYIGYDGDCKEDYSRILSDRELSNFICCDIGTKINGYTLIAKWED